MKKLWFLVFLGVFMTAGIANAGERRHRAHEHEQEGGRNGGKGLPPHIIDNIQQKFGGRVVSATPDNGDYDVQVMNNGRVSIVTVDEDGNILGVQQ
jgi:hypothetical protein